MEQQWESFVALFQISLEEKDESWVHYDKMKFVKPFLNTELPIGPNENDTTKSMDLLNNNHESDSGGSHEIQQFSNSSNDESQPKKRNLTQ